MADVFISYANEDRDRVRPLAEALVARGLSVWWDRALAAGDDYAAVIARELEAAKGVIVVWTAAASASPWVRDEAARARDSGRLVPVMLDQGEIPLGFGQVHAEDLSGWSGAANAAEIDILVESVRARIEGRSPDGAAIASKRKRAARRVRLMTALGAVAALAVIVAAGAVIYTARQPAPPPPVSHADKLANLLRLVEEGKITGDQAVELAKLLQAQAFETMAAAASGEDAGVAPLAAEATVSAEEARSAAGETFEQALAELFQDPDVRVRRAALAASDPQTRAAGLSQMETLAAEGSASAGALLRAAGALQTVEGDAKAVETLEAARIRNPQDRRVWQMLSFAYARQSQPEAAQGAAMVGEGLEQAAAGAVDQAAKSLEAALPLLRAPQDLAFVRGQTGDLAAENQDWATAEHNYREAVRLHTERKDIAALSVDASKLARAQLAQDNAREACRTLQGAADAGASVSEEEMREACGRRPLLRAPVQIQVRPTAPP